MKTLKIVRVAVAIGMGTLVTLFFLGLGGGFGLLERIQLMPALLGCACVPLAVWIVVTLMFGRVYCSMVCPLGILQDVLGRLVRRHRAYVPARARRWLPMVSLIVWALLILVGGASLAGLAEPYSVFGRIAGQVFQPLADMICNALADWLGTDGAVVLFKREVFVRSLSGFVVAGSSFMLLVLLVAWKGRLVCNTVCPAGALLALLSRKTVFTIRIDSAKCVACGLCSRVCKAQCLNGKNRTVDNARCVRCFNCLGVCAKGAIAFSSALKSPIPTDATRRNFVTGIGAGIAAVGAAVCGKSIVLSMGKGVVLPPPGTDADRLRKKCTACGLCVARCPQQVLTPVGFSEYGPLGLLLPKMSFVHGFCDPSCTMCGDVCPTGAISQLDGAGKKSVKIGCAVFDRAKCLVCTEQISCGLCAKRCVGKAITLKAETIRVGDKTAEINIPVVDNEKCIGCGACENYCPSHAMSVIPS